MAVDSTRISQVLPEVKCSKCSASISLDDMTTHTCLILPKLQPILERATNNGNGNGHPSSQIDRGLFNSANYVTPQNAYQRHVDDNSRADLPLSGTTTHTKPQHKQSYSNASAVLGRLDSVKAGVLDATGLHRPQQQTRLGPVQLRDPRATIVPIQSNGRYHNRDNVAVPSPVPEMPYLPQRTEDSMSVLSDRSVRSGRSGWSSNEHLSKPNSAGNDSCFSISSTDHGPFHHVGTRLDPNIFILDETPTAKYNTKKSSVNAKKVKRPIKDSYDDEWADQGYEQDISPYNPALPRSQLPSRAGAAQYQPAPLSRSNNFSQESSSSRESLPRKIDGRAIPSRDVPRTQPQDTTNFGDWHSRRQQLEAIRTRKQQTMSTSRPSTSDSADSLTDPYNQVPPPPQQVQALHNRTHTRHETSSSLGTMLTTSTAQSARSSTSSPPSSERNFNHHKFRREDKTTPRLQHMYDESHTPKPGMAASRTVPRSDTTESFDRLLQDIGSSIDELDTPKAPFVQVIDGSPSSNYSPNLPQPARFGSSPAATTTTAIQRLGSPASLRSKETVSSNEGGGGSVHSKQNRKDRTTTTDSRCRACDGLITGRSVSSADGKLTGRYHKACFRCAAPDCPRAQFIGGAFYVFDDRPLCAAHYHRLAGSVCAHCGEGVEGRCFATADGRKVHPACHAVKF